MINRKSIWILTLFSLILVLSVYYITMPSEFLETASKNVDNSSNTSLSLFVNIPLLIFILTFSLEVYIYNYSYYHM